MNPPCFSYQLNSALTGHLYLWYGTYTVDDDPTEILGILWVRDIDNCRFRLQATVRGC